MYRGTPSPIFDVPEFPTLRRVKPLPKRRRTTSSSGAGGNDTLLSLSPATASALAAQGASILQQSAAAAALLSQAQGQGGLSGLQGQGQQGLDALGLGPNPTPEELLAHGDTLSARMALQNYYMPILGGVQSLLASATNAASAGDGVNNSGSGDNGNNNTSTTTAAAAAAAALAAVAGAGRNGQLPLPLSDLDSLELGVHFAAAAAAAAAAGVAMGGLGSLGLGLPGMNLLGNINNNVGLGAGLPQSATSTIGLTRDHEDDDRGHDDNDYVDHLRQPGNTKKRKVPTNASPRGSGLVEGRPGSPLSSYLDEDGLDGAEGVEDLQLQLHLQREREVLERDRERDRDRDHYHRDRDRSRSRDDYSPGRAHPPYPAYHHHHSRSNSSSNSNGSNNNHGYTYTGSSSNPAYAPSGSPTSLSSNSLATPFQVSSLLLYPPPPYPGQLEMLKRKRGKLTAVTLAGLQHKELLKTRKRQLAAVMGALSHGDTLALDQALTSASYGYGVALSGGGGAPPVTPATGSTGDGDGEGEGGEGDGHEEQGQLQVRGQLVHQGPGIRKSKRRSVRLARAMKVLMDTPERRVRHPDVVPFPESRFEFVCYSGTADRLSATKEEVATLRKRFEAEFEKQAAKAARMAASANNVTNVIAPAPTSMGTAGEEKPRKVAKASGGKGKRARQEKERAERAQAQIQQQQQQQKVAEKNASVDVNANVPSGKENVDVSAQGQQSATPTPTGKSKNGKKKKRSALANASNPHHLRNYVPSRLPHSDGHGVHASGGANTAANTIWPLPVKFLSAEIPPKVAKGEGGGRRGKKSAPNGNTHHSSGPPGSNIPLAYPGEEWICPFCEYDLFYGGDAEYKRAVRNRKKILRRRRRARERAARAASGVKTAAPAAAPAAAPVAPPPSEDGEEEDEGYGDEEVYEEVVGPGEDGRQVVEGVGGGGRWKGGGDG